MLGHAQVSTTMNVYAHGFQSQLREASAKMNEDWETRTSKANMQRTAV
jgi:integrase